MIPPIGVSLQNQSSASVSPVPVELLSIYDFKSTGTNLHDGSRAGSRLDLSNKGDGTPSRRVSKRDPSGVTAGNTARSTSRRCFTPPGFRLVLNDPGVRS